MAERIEVTPESLNNIRTQFLLRADVHRQQLTALRNEMNALRAEFLGDAATAHYNEMEQLVFPGYTRLIEALTQAAQEVQQTQTAFESAQVAGGQPFKQLAQTGAAEVAAATKAGKSGSPGSMTDSERQGAGSGGAPSGGGPSPSGSGSGTGDSDGGTSSPNSGGQSAGVGGTATGAGNATGLSNAGGGAATPGGRSGAVAAPAAAGGGSEGIAGAVAAAGGLAAAAVKAKKGRNG